MIQNRSREYNVLSAGNIRLRSYIVQYIYFMHIEAPVDGIPSKTWFPLKASLWFRGNYSDGRQPR